MTIGQRLAKLEGKKNPHGYLICFVGQHETVEQALSKINVNKSVEKQILWVSWER
jgi:hypothetical protein